MFFITIKGDFSIKEFSYVTNFESFKAGGVGLALDQFSGKSEYKNKEMKEIMQAIPNRQEYSLAQGILEKVADYIYIKNKNPQEKL